MRILMITPHPPAPTGGGLWMRMFGVLRSLATRHAVTLAAFRKPGQTVEDSALEGSADRVVFIPGQSVQDQPQDAWSRRGRTIRNCLTDGLPARFRAYQSPEASEILTQLYREEFDLVWQEEAATVAPYHPVDPDRVILDVADVETVRLWRELGITPFSRQKILQYVEWTKWFHYERRVLRRYCRVLVCSEKDARRLGGANVDVLPNSVVVPPSMRLAGKGEKRIVYVGSMDYEPNADAALWFAREAFPLIRGKTPGAHLVIVGGDPPPKVCALHDGREIVVTGRVPSVLPYLSESDIMVVPLRAGGGTRVKILEAAAHGLPVVATSLGAEGLDLIPGEHLLVADRPEALASACVRLLEDAGLRERMALAAFEIVKTQYSMERMEDRVQEIVESVGRRR